jgi:hypothetical protein
VGTTAEGEHTGENRGREASGGEEAQGIFSTMLFQSVSCSTINATVEGITGGKSQARSSSFGGFKALFPTRIALESILNRHLICLGLGHHSCSL